MLLAPLSAGFQSLPHSPQTNRALLVLIPSGWACVRSRTPWVSPASFPVRLGVSSAGTATPTGVCSQRFEALFLGLEPWVVWSVSLPRCSSWFICSLMWDCLVHQLRPHPPAAALPGIFSAQLPVPAPPTGLGECFFLNSFVVGLPYSSIFWPFWLCFVLKFVVVLLMVVQGGTVCLPVLPSWLT